MSLWWLQPEWKKTLCQRCGTNVWDAGGDPDHGLCPPCFDRQWHENQAAEEARRHRMAELVENDSIERIKSLMPWRRNHDGAPGKNEGE